MYLMMMHDRPTSWPAPRAIISSSLRVAMLRGACSGLRNLPADHGRAPPPAPRRPARRYCRSRQRRGLAWRRARGKRQGLGGRMRGRRGVTAGPLVVTHRSCANV